MLAVLATAPLASDLKSGSYRDLENADRSGSSSAVFKSRLLRYESCHWVFLSWTSDTPVLPNLALDGNDEATVPKSLHWLQLV